jgi:polyhydroxyalkanoate synthesis regulator phasin
MAQNDMLKRYLDAGLAFTQMTRERADAIVKDLVKAGEIQREQAQERVEDLVERSRRNTEQLVELVRKEITAQIRQLGVVTRTDMSRLEKRVDSLFSAAGSGAKKAAPAKAAAPAKKAPAAKKAAAKKAPAKKAAAAKKAPAKKAPAKKAAGGVKKA